MTRIHILELCVWEVYPVRESKSQTKHQTALELTLFEIIARKTHLKCVLNEVATNAQETQQARINANGMHYACSLHALHCALCSA